MTLGILKQHSRCQYEVKPLLRLSLFSETNLTKYITICSYLKGKQSVIFSLSDMLDGILKYWKVILWNTLLAYVILSTVLYVFEHFCGMTFSNNAVGIVMDFIWWRLKLKLLEPRCWEKYGLYYFWLADVKSKSWQNDLWKYNGIVVFNFSSSSL